MELWFLALFFSLGHNCFGLNLFLRLTSHPPHTQYRYIVSLGYPSTLFISYAASGRGSDNKIVILLSVIIDKIC